MKPDDQSIIKKKNNTTITPSIVINPTYKSFARQTRDRTI